MVITSQVLSSFCFSMTIDFLRECTPRVPVKTLRIKHFSADNENFRYGYKGVNAIHQLLAAIPEDSLTHLEYVPQSVTVDEKTLGMRLTRQQVTCATNSSVLSKNLMTKIDQRQRRLTNYQYIGFHHRDRDWNEFEVENQYLTGIRHLQFSFHNRYMCELADNVLTCMRNLTRLDVEGQISISDDTNLAIWQFILRTFSVENGLPHLRSLRLKGLRLIHNDDTAPRLPGLRHLEHLQLILCCDYVPFLLMLAELSPKLKSFTVCEGGRDGGLEFNGDADEFVRSLGSLQRLGLILDPNWVGPHDSLFDWSTLHAHAAGIKSLKVHGTSQHRQFALNQDIYDFRHFCIRASSLQQLSVSGVAIQPCLPRYSAFENEPSSLAHLLVCPRLSQPKIVLQLTDI